MGITRCRGLCLRLHQAIQWQSLTGSKALELSDQSELENVPTAVRCRQLYDVGGEERSEEAVLLQQLVRRRLAEVFAAAARALGLFFKGRIH